MNLELAQLESELTEVMACEFNYLPKYGYSPKDEIIEQIEQDIEDVKAKISANEFDYSDEELELERATLCQSLGIPRYC